MARTLQGLSQAEAEAIAQVLDEISRPLLDQQVTQALTERGRLEYDGDLTGRPVSNTSTTYPAAAFGHMDDEVRLGYQAAVVSVGSPTYRRLWLSVKPHPGQLLSCQLTKNWSRRRKPTPACGPKGALICSPSVYRQPATNWRSTGKCWRTGNSDWLSSKLSCRCAASAGRAASWWSPSWRPTSRPAAGLRSPIALWPKPAAALGTGAAATSDMRELVRTRKLIQRQQLAIGSQEAQAAQLQARLRRFEGENAGNVAPVQAVFRLDAGFATWDNVALLIELGYEVYSRPYNQKVRAALLRRTGPATPWTQVGDNAEMIAWAHQQLKGCPYPVDVALERFYTGKTLRYGVLLHFGADRVTADLPAWFAYYNARQTIEAGIKEGKGVFQMHYLKVRSAPALWLQEQFATFAANFIRWAAYWLSRHSYQEPRHWLQPLAASVKTLVQVAAHTPATVEWLPDSCLLRFTDESPYAGRVIQTGGCAFQLSLPIFQNVDSDPISTNRALIVQ